MENVPRLPGFVYLRAFERVAKGALSEADRHELEKVLAEYPEIGDVMVGTGGVRKMRFAREGEGKRGGLRVVYYYRSNVGRIYLLTTYPKNVKDNLSKEARNKIKALTAQLDGEA